jgi:hypothetical protein
MPTLCVCVWDGDDALQLTVWQLSDRGLAAQATKIAAQPVGFAAGVQAAEERISALLSTGKVHPKQPIVAIENFLVEVEENK